MTGKQEKIDKLVYVQLPEAISSGLTAVVNWTKAYAQAEGSGIDHHRLDAFNQLRDAGFSSHEHTGDQFIKGNKYSMGRYIVGQIMSLLEEDSPLPNACSFFPDQYNEMPGEPVPPEGVKVPGPRNIPVMRPLKLKFGP